MPKPTTHEALVYLMVITSASDRDMTDEELRRIGEVTRWPVFQDFDNGRLVAIAQDCQRLLHAEEGMEGVMRLAAAAIPERLHDTAYAAAVEVASADLEIRMEERRILELLLRHLKIDEAAAIAVALSSKARHRTLT